MFGLFALVSLMALWCELVVSHGTKFLQGRERYLALHAPDSRLEVSRPNSYKETLLWTCKPLRQLLLSG